MSMDWISSEGGPLVLVGRKYLAFWKGVVSDDFDRACAVDSYAGVISVSASQGLVLGDDPCRTAIYSSENIGVLIVRWEWAESERSIHNVLENLTSRDFRDSQEETEYTVYDESLLLFDAALPGEEAGGLELNLPESTYLVTTVRLTPNDETSLILHRFKVKS